MGHKKTNKKGNTAPIRDRQSMHKISLIETDIKKRRTEIQTFDIEKPLHRSRLWLFMMRTIPIVNIIGVCSLTFSLTYFFSKNKFPLWDQFTASIALILMVSLKFILSAVIPFELKKAHLGGEIDRLQWLIPLNYIVGILLMSFCIFPIIYYSGMPQYA